MKSSNNAPPPAAGAPPMLVTRGLSGFAELLFQELDKMAAGATPDTKRIDAIAKSVNAHSRLLRDAMAIERHRSSIVNTNGIVIEHTAPAE